jgi:pilus assembly protein FimV
MRKLALIATICLTCIADVAWALGVGNIELYSALNQPLQAEIPLFSLRAGEASLVKVDLAPDSAFARAGTERADILSNLRFRVVPGASPDRAVIQVTSKQPIREPFLSMMLEVSWPDGRLVREYTVLLDPPVIAQGQTTRRPATQFNQPISTSPLAGRYDPPAATPAARAEGGQYGPVRKQETLWSIAYANRPDDSVSMDQMMQAIYEANPEAFDGDITRIRAGAMLRIPDASEIRSSGRASAPREARRPPPASSTSSAPDTVESPARPGNPVTETVPAQAETKPQGELRLSTPEESAGTAGDSVMDAPAETPEAAAGSATTTPAPAEASGAKTAAPIQVRDNSAKALELLASHAREHESQQPVTDPGVVEPAQVAPPPAQAEAAKPETVAPPAEAPAPAAPAPATPAETPAAEATADSPFVDPADAPTAAPVEEAPPVPAAETPPAPAKPAVVDDSLPTPADEETGLNPMLFALIAAGVLLLGLAAAAFRKYRARKDTVQLAPIVFSQPADNLTESPFAQTLEPAARPKARLDSTLGNTTKPVQAPAARALDSTLQSTVQATMPPAQTTQKFMAVSSPEPTMPAMIESGDVPSNDPFADVLGEVDIHIAYGLYDEAARLLQEPLAKSPERKDLHLKLLEVHFSANMPEEFEAQARKMKERLSSPNDPDWEKVCIMGRQLCPNSPLFADDGGAGGSGLGAVADLDLTSMLGGNAPPTPTAKPAAKPVVASAPAAESGKDLPALDLDLSGFNLGVETSAAAKPAASTPVKPATPAEKKASDSNSLDFDLSDFSLDAPAAPASAVPAPAKPAAKLESAADDNGLDIDLSDFDLAGTDTATTPAATAPASSAAAKAGDDDLSLDDLMSTDIEAGEGQADTRLDLARAYIDMGEPTMAQTLLQEVLAQGSAEQKKEAQELLGKLGTT